MSLRLLVRCTEVRVFEPQQVYLEDDLTPCWAASFVAATDSKVPHADAFTIFRAGGDFEVGRKYNIEITRAKDAKK